MPFLQRQARESEEGGLGLDGQAPVRLILIDV
jgi:hypothetical protein